MSVRDSLLPWDSQPQEQVALRDPTFGDLAVFGGFGSPRSSAGVASLASGPGGIALTTDGAAGSYFDVGSPRYMRKGSTTWVVVFSTSATSGPNYFSGTVDTGSSYIEDLLVNSQSQGNGPGRLEFVSRGAEGIPLAHTTDNIGVNDGRVHCAVWTFTPETGRVFSCHVDGHAANVTGNSVSLDDYVPPSGSATEYPLWLHTRNVRGSPSVGGASSQRIYLYARLMRRLDDPAFISANPFQLFEPKRIGVPRSVTAVAPTLLTASAINLTSTSFRPRVTFTR